MAYARRNVEANLTMRCPTAIVELENGRHGCLQGICNSADMI